MPLSVRHCRTVSEAPDCRGDFHAFSCFHASGNVAHSSFPCTPTLTSYKLLDIERLSRVSGARGRPWRLAAAWPGILCLQPPGSVEPLRGLGLALRLTPLSGLFGITLKTNVLGEKVFHMCWTSQSARPNSYRFMKSPITRSCICSVLEKHPLEGSCQEARRLPYATFDNFFPLRST